MTESDYKALVLTDYDRKLRNGELSAELVSPSPGNLKAESARVCERRFDRKDELLLESFFNRKEGAAGYRSAILNCNAELFKPVVRLLRERDVNTQVRNINLLAWLIDFKPRPYRFDMQIGQEVGAIPPVTDSESLGNGEMGVGPDPSSGPNANTAPLPDADPGSGDQSRKSMPEREKSDTTAITRSRFDKRWFIALGIVLIIIVIALFKKEPNDCMYWSDDHYVATSCSIPRGETPLIEYNRHKFENFHKLKRTDTLTRNSLGHLWFTRVGDSLEVFTMEGRHPLYKDKKLRELSDFAINFCRNRKGKIGGR